MSKIKPIGLDIIAMVDVEFYVKDNAFSLHLPVYYRKDPESFMLFFDLDRQTTIVTRSSSIACLAEEFKQDVQQYFRDKK